MAKFMHQEVMKATKATMGATCYVTFSCDNFSTMDSQSWFHIHYYVMQTRVRIPILISLDQMIRD
jgi:hypothetical protein